MCLLMDCSIVCPPPFELKLYEGRDLGTRVDTSTGRDTHLPVHTRPDTQGPKTAPVMGWIALNKYLLGERKPTGVPLPVLSIAGSR